MPRALVEDLEIELLGDPHLGRRFITGVPLHRRGDRERTVWADFHRSLRQAKGAAAHICLGDLFDRSVVPFNVVLKAADAYRRAAKRNPGTRFIVLKGNHDDSRDADFRTALDVFERLLAGSANVEVVQGEAQIICLDAGDRAVRLAICPWHPFTPAEAIAQALVDQDPAPVAAAFGHWDLDAYGQAADNVVPHRILSALTDTLYTGHVHLPTTRRFGAVTVHVVGAMQPYAHGEDPTGDLYQTLPLEVVTRALEEDPERFREICLRVVVPPGEAAPDNIECLQLLVKRLDEVEADAMVDFERFDLDALFDETFAAHGVPAAIVGQIRARLGELRAESTEIGPEIGEEVGS